MQLLSLIASAAAGHEEPDKTLYYVGAAVFSLWAVLVSAIGIARADFGSTVAAKRGIATVSVLMFAGMLACVLATN